MAINFTPPKLYQLYTLQEPTIAAPPPPRRRRLKWVSRATRQFIIELL